MASTCRPAIAGTTVGIVGCGHIGKEVVQLLAPFQCTVLAHDIRDYAAFYGEHGVRAVGLEELLKQSDVVTLHVPLDAGARSMLDDSRLNLMKPSAILINTARGGLVDETALKARLKDGRLSGAAFDVLSRSHHRTRNCSRCQTFSQRRIWPGGSSQEAILAMGRSGLRPTRHR